MRLSKRIAIGVMAVALALSMTACGGDVPEQPSNSGAGGTNTSTGSDANTGTDTGDKKDETITTPPKDDNKNDDKKDTMPAQTRAEKFFSGRYVINGAKWTYTVQHTSISVNSGRQETGNYIIASDGKRTMDRCLFDNGKDLTQIIDWQQQTRYHFDSTDSDGSVNVQHWEEDYSDTNYGYLCYDVWRQRTYKKPSLREFADEYTAGTYQVDGVNYYGESYAHTYNDGMGSQEVRIYCFDQGDTEGLNLRYYINIRRNGNGENEHIDKYKVLSVSNTFDANYLQVPEGRSIWLRVGNDYVLQEEKTPKDNYPN